MQIYLHITKSRKHKLNFEIKILMQIEARPTLFAAMLFNNFVLTVFSAL